MSDSSGSITWGSHFKRTDKAAIGGQKITIYGRVLTKEEIVAGEMRCGASEEEARWTLSNIVSAYARGSRWVKAFSVVVPEGELGFSPTWDATIITRAEFDAACKRGWT